MQEESRDHQFAVSDFVNDHTANDDTEAKTGKASSADQSVLQIGEAEFGRPGCIDAITNGESDTRRENRHKSRP